MCLRRGSWPSAVRGQNDTFKGLASAAYAIVFTSYFGARVIQWLWRRKQAGLLLLALRTPLPMMISLGIILGVFLSLLIIGGTYELIHDSGPWGALLGKLCSRIAFMSFP